MCQMDVFVRLTEIDEGSERERKKKRNWTEWHNIESEEGKRDRENEKEEKNVNDYVFFFYSTLKCDWSRISHVTDGFVFGIERNRASTEMCCCCMSFDWNEVSSKMCAS